MILPPVGGVNSGEVLAPEPVEQGHQAAEGDEMEQDGEGHKAVRGGQIRPHGVTGVMAVQLKAWIIGRRTGHGLVLLGAGDGAGQVIRSRIPVKSSRDNAACVSLAWATRCLAIT